jgi:hypothetical protein
MTSHATLRRGDRIKQVAFCHPFDSAYLLHFDT